MTNLKLEEEVTNPNKDKDLSYSHHIQTSCGATQPPMQWAPRGSFFVSGRDVKLTTCFHLMLRLIMHGAIPHMSS
jgi:hypothetical protein